MPVAVVAAAMAMAVVVATAVDGHALHDHRLHEGAGRVDDLRLRVLHRGTE
jgi:hypothetical protein